MLGVAVAGPLVVRTLLVGGPSVGESAFLVCLFLPTPADWPLHMVVYVVAGLLFIGLLSGIGSFLCQWYRTRRLMQTLLKFRVPVRDIIPTELLAPLGLQGRVDVINVTRPIALCYGLLRPRICLATGALAGLNRLELEALLLHERYHLLHRDPLKTGLSRVLTGAFFYLPVVRALQQQYLIAKEIEADMYVLQNQRTQRPLLGALYKLLLQQSHADNQDNLAVARATDSLNQRLDFLLSGRAPDGLRSPVLFTSAAMIAALCTITAFVTWASVANALWEQAHLGMGGC